MFKHPAARLGTLCVTLAACGSSESPDFTGPEVTPAAIEAIWASKHSLSASHLAARAGAVDDIIYLVGGTNSSKETVGTVRAYTIATNTWSYETALPSPRSAVNGVSVIGGKLYVSGGFDDNGVPARTLYVYNRVTDHWTKRADMPAGGACGSQGVIAGKLYVYTRGGGSCSGAHAFYRYDPGTNKWTLRAAPPSLHLSAVSGVIAGKFYLAGGGANKTFVPSYALHVYTPATNSWATRASLPGRHQDAAGAALKGKLYLAGGADYFAAGSPPIGTLRVYDPATNSWATKVPMPTPRHSAAGINAGGALWVISGWASTGRSTKVEMYEPYIP